ncbi:hypothetical protein C440_10763 [Haloferax mucosum ATCC BAA-1512]|uniref:Uncharacterized protein n=1 Tax=Haloferax mucosum ATCC BAA-1512 TaxID=662479 RepID=M0IBG8_9EURY|nr:hypothetical protein [Haloferax mucosum]ELZ94096.1 hypothetical protein C440_10763 [Haloferax mucosum ATCC BAA-1512]
MDSDERFEDPIASALLSDSHYEQLRIRRFSLFKQSLPRKLAWQSLILAALTMVLPLAMTLPASTRALFPDGDPLWAAPKILLLGAYAGAIETVAALGLVYVGYRRLTRGGALSEREARQLLNIEDVASMISLVTGLFAVVAVNGFFLLGHGGKPAMSMFLAAGGNNPFAGTPIPVPVFGVAVTAGVLSILVFAASRVFDRLLPV